MKLVEGKKDDLIKMHGENTQSQILNEQKNK